MHIYGRERICIGVHCFGEKVHGISTFPTLKRGYHIVLACKDKGLAIEAV